MLAKLKLVAYGVLIPLVIWFSWGFYTNYKFVSDAAAQEDKMHFRQGAKVLEPETTADSTISSGLRNDPTTPVPTNTVEITNISASVTSESGASEVVSTNEVEGESNLVAAAETKAKKKKKAMDLVKLSANQNLSFDEQLIQAQKSMAKNLTGLVVSAIFLALLLGYDLPAYFAHRGVDMLFDDDHDASKDPEYERAEQVWAEGKPMEAIEIMRGYLKRNPREQYVALRIAEIYEKDFRNYLAAALEYEEVLKHKLAPERWSWAAIHLCNLYTKLGRDAEHTKLLERIVREYPNTGGAKKARVRLGIPEGGEVPTEAPEPAPEQSVKEIPPQDDPPSNLPKGFRPRK